MVLKGDPLNQKLQGEVRGSKMRRKMRRGVGERPAFKQILDSDVL